MGISLEPTRKGSPSAASAAATHNAMRAMLTSGMLRSSAGIGRKFLTTSHDDVPASIARVCDFRCKSNAPRISTSMYAPTMLLLPVLDTTPNSMMPARVPAASATPMRSMRAITAAPSA